MLWNTKNEIPIGRGKREIEGTADRQPYRPIPQSQNQKQIGSENGDDQKRQKFGLPITVKEQARDNQQLDLKRSKRREIVGPKYDRNEYAELPRCESHAAPLVISRNLTPRPDRVQPEPWFQPAETSLASTGFSRSRARNTV